jgi:hypothetical protein
VDESDVGFAVCTEVSAEEYRGHRKDGPDEQCGE